MLKQRLTRRLSIPVLIAGLIAGCGGPQEIPLADVPPPPAGFGDAAKASKKLPKGGSPTDIARYTR